VLELLTTTNEQICLNSCIRKDSFNVSETPNCYARECVPQAQNALVLGARLRSSPDPVVGWGISPLHSLSFTPSVH